MPYEQQLHVCACTPIACACTKISYLSLLTALVLKPRDLKTHSYDKQCQMSVTVMETILKFLEDNRVKKKKLHLY